MMMIVNSKKDNEAKLDTINGFKIPYLFSSSDLIQMLNCTPSVKTKIKIIASIGPRLTDPKAKASELAELFRYVEEKQEVEEILKSRAVVLGTNAFVAKSATTAVSSPSGSGSTSRSPSITLNRGGRGGRSPSITNAGRGD